MILVRERGVFLGSLFVFDGNTKEDLDSKMIISICFKTCSFMEDSDSENFRFPDFPTVINLIGFTT
jgi:hypothetical protein